MNITRRRFLQGTAALFCAPAIVKADHLMKIYVPEIQTATFTITGLQPGSVVRMVATDIPEEGVIRIADELGVAKYDYVRQGSDIIVTARKPNYRSIYFSMKTDEKSKVHGLTLQQQKDIVSW